MKVRHADDGDAEVIAWGCDLLEVSSGRRPERDAAHAAYRAAGFADAADRSVRYRKELAAS